MTEPDDPAGRTLAELTDALRRQLDLVRAEDYAAMLPAAKAVARALDRLARLDPALLAPLAPQVRQVEALHRQVCLTLRAQRQDLAEQMARLRTGGTAVRAYRGGASGGAS